MSSRARSCIRYIMRQQSSNIVLVLLMNTQQTDCLQGSISLLHVIFSLRDNWSISRVIPQTALKVVPGNSDHGGTMRK